MTDTFNALKMMISYNKLHEVLQYYNELQVEHNLDAVLSTMTQKSWIRNYDFWLINTVSITKYPRKNTLYIMKRHFSQ